MLLSSRSLVEFERYRLARFRKILDTKFLEQVWLLVGFFVESYCRPHSSAQLSIQIAIIGFD